MISGKNCEMLGRFVCISMVELSSDDKISTEYLLLVGTLFKMFVLVELPVLGFTIEVKGPERSGILTKLVLS